MHGGEGNRNPSSKQKNEMQMEISLAQSLVCSGDQVGHDINEPVIGKVRIVMVFEVI